MLDQEVSTCTVVFTYTVVWFTENNFVVADCEYRYEWSNCDSQDEADATIWQAVDLYWCKVRTASTMKRKLFVKFCDYECKENWANVTACSPKKLDVQGRDLKDVCLLRTPDEANYIAAAGKDKNIVIVGASFLGNFDWIKPIFLFFCKASWSTSLWVYFRCFIGCSYLSFLGVF